MKKTFAIFILCCLLLLTGGYHLFYALRIREVKLEMKQTLLSAKEDQLIRFDFTESEISSLAWEDEHEFQYDNEMYDVLKKEVKEGKTILYCLSDTKEKALLDALLQTQQQSSRHSSTEIVKLLTAVFLPVSEVVVLLPEKDHLKNKPPFLFFIPQRSTLILTPPPQVA